MQKQGLRQELTPKPTQIMDIVDLQSAALAAQAEAEKLVEKHGKDMEAIKKEAFSIKNPYKGFDLMDEIVWAAQWLLAAQKSG